MNYTSAAVGFVMLVALITWFTTGRRHFTGPRSGGVRLEGDGEVEVDGKAEGEKGETAMGVDGLGAGGGGGGGEKRGMSAQEEREKGVV